MIKNERQYKATKAAAARFERALEELRNRDLGAEGIHPRIARARIEGAESQLEDLRRELCEYESLKKGTFPLDELERVKDIPNLLIKARIAQQLTQKQLATRTGLYEQQIQKYEATNYDSASFARIQLVADALCMSSDENMKPTV